MSRCRGWLAQIESDCDGDCGGSVAYLFQKQTS